MILRPVMSMPKIPGQWTPVRMESNSEPTGVMLCCPGCGSSLHLGPAPHPSGHEILWEDSFKRFSIRTPIICGISRSGKRCEWIGMVEHGVVIPS